MITSQQPRIAALPAKQRPELMPTSGTAPRQLAPELEAAREAAALGVAGPPAAALGEEHRRQPPALRQLDHPVHLLVVVGALGAGQHRVVVGQHRARAPRPRRTGRR